MSQIEHNHETGGAWSLMRWQVPGCKACWQCDRADEWPDGGSCITAGSEVWAAEGVCGLCLTNGWKRL